MTSASIVAYATKMSAVLKKKHPDENIPMQAGKLYELCMAVVDAGTSKTRPPLTKPEADALKTVTKMLAAGENPTLRSLSDAMGYTSHNSTRVLIDRLKAYGYLKREEKTNRLVLA